MLAFDIICEIVRIGELPDCGTFVYDENSSLKDWFGPESHTGEMEDGKYFYLYAENWADKMSQMPKPDVFIETEEAGNIWLWKVED